MGQRANYIIKDQNGLTIHYNHWRAYCIAADLYLGEKKFLEFVRNCQLNDDIMNEPWIEGCVVIDRDARKLLFWSFDFNETSVIEYYLTALRKKWTGWEVQILKNRMYDVEGILGIDYISKQDIVKLENNWSEEDIIDDKVNEWVTALVIIKSDDELFITKTGSLNSEAIVGFGQKIIRLLQDKPTCELPNEGDEATCECVIIDVLDKKLFVNLSQFGLWEQAKDLWEGFDFIMGDMGYIETLRLAGIATTNLAMPDDKVLERFENIVNHDSDFDPYKMAARLTRENNDIQFNPDFFDTVKPRKAFWDQVRKIFGGK